MAVRQTPMQTMQMEVRVNGEIEWRLVASIERRADEFGSPARQHYFQMHIPEHAENERCVWNIGSDIPDIVRIA